MSNETKTEERQKCGRCKVNLPLSKFKRWPRTGDLYKQCIDCNSKQKKHRKRCSEPGCNNGVQQGGVCVKHGSVTTRCSEPDCNNKAVKGGVCVKHGAERKRCSEPDCNNKAVKDGVCFKHGAERKRCSEPGCNNGAVKGGVCIKHGAQPPRCEHDTIKRQCKVCDPLGHLAGVTSRRIHHALKGNKENRTVDYLGCTIAEFKEHIESTWKEGMSWDNHGQGKGHWNIDHITPLRYGDPDLADVIARLHWKNTKALWADENVSKGNRFVG